MLCLPRACVRAKGDGEGGGRIGPLKGPILPTTDLARRGQYSVGILPPTSGGSRRNNEGRGFTPSPSIPPEPYLSTSGPQKGPEVDARRHNDRREGLFSFRKKARTEGVMSTS